MANNSSTYLGYRWVMFVLGVLAALSQTIVWLSPAPLLTTIVQDLKINFGQAGMLLTVIPLLSGIFMFAGSFVIDKLGVKRAMIVAMFVMGIGGILSFFAKSYAIILIARIIVGVGCGLVPPVIGALIMSWFPPKEQPYINTINSALGFGRQARGSGRNIQQALLYLPEDSPNILIPLYRFLESPAQLADRTPLHPKIFPDLLKIQPAVLITQIHTAFLK